MEASLGARLRKRLVQFRLGRTKYLHCKHRSNLHGRLVYTGAVPFPPYDTWDKYRRKDGLGRSLNLSHSHMGAPQSHGSGGECPVTNKTRLTTGLSSLLTECMHSVRSASSTGSCSRVTVICDNLRGFEGCVGLLNSSCDAKSRTQMTVGQTLFWSLDLCLFICGCCMV